MKSLSHLLLASASAVMLGLATPAYAERVLTLNESPIGEIDPAKGTDYADTVLAINLYDSLVYPTQGGPGVQPWLATEWTVEGLTYTFTLKEGVQFSSGNALTADDVVYSFNRLVALGQGFANLFEGRVETVEAIDPLTVAFTLTEDYAPFLAALVRLSIVDSETLIANQGDGPYGEFGDYASDWLSANSAGSGGYMVESQNPQSETMMVQNPYYHEDYAENAPERVRYRYGIEASTLRALMSRGEIDIADLWLPPEVIRAMVEDGGVYLATEPAATGEYIHLNTRRAPLDDVHCRLALQYAFDYATTAQLLAITEDYNQGIPMSGALPSGLLGYPEDGTPYEQDLDRANAELELCQYDPASSPLELAWIAEVPARERIALIMQAAFTQLGFPVSVVRTPWALVTEQVTDPETAPHAVEIAVSAVTPDPDSLLFNMYSSTVPPTWMSASALADDTVDALLEAGRNVVDEAERAEIYAELHTAIGELAPAIFAYEFIGVYAIREGVEVPNLMDDDRRYSLASYSLLFKDISIND